MNRHKIVHLLDLDVNEKRRHFQLLAVFILQLDRPEPCTINIPIITNHGSVETAKIQVKDKATCS